MASEIPSQMRAARIIGFNKGYEVVDTPTPSDLGADDILLQIKAAGYCHTDLQVLQGVYESAGAKPGLIGSHEPVGVVVKLGSKADKYGLKLGDRVGSINTYGYCGKCKSCKQGFQVCDNVSGMLGLTLDGGFAQYMKADARVVSKIPDVIPWAEAAPLFCAGATTYGAIQRAGVTKGEWIVHIGIGGLGHLGIQYSKALGQKVIAIDSRQEGIDVANDVPAHLKPDMTFLVENDEAKDEVVKRLSESFYDTNPGVDKVIINAEARPLVKFAQQFLRKGGTLVDVGLPSDGPLEVDPFALNFKEQTLRGRLICTPAECQDMINLHAEHKCRVHIDKTYGVEQMNDLYNHYQQHDLKGRVCMVF